MTRENGKSSIPEILSPESFWKELKSRRFPIRERNAYQYARHILSQFPPPHFLSKVIESLQFTDKNQFDQYVKAATQAVKQHVGQQPYYAAFTDIPSSGSWLYDLLERKGVPGAQGFAIADCYNGIARGTTDHIPTGASLLLADDFAISGAQLTDDLLNPRTGFIRPHSEFTVNAFLLQSHPIARNRILRFANSVTSVGPDILRLSDTMDRAELNFLTGLELQLARDDLITDESLFFTWYKLPDNIPKTFTHSHYRLFEEQDFRPPYRK